MHPGKACHSPEGYSKATLSTLSKHKEQQESAGVTATIIHGENGTVGLPSSEKTASASCSIQGILPTMPSCAPHAPNSCQIRMQSH